MLLGQSSDYRRYYVCFARVVVPEDGSAIVGAKIMLSSTGAGSNLRCKGVSDMHIENIVIIVSIVILKTYSHHKQKPGY
jgi:hypothetical protein